MTALFAQLNLRTFGIITDLYPKQVLAKRHIDMLTAQAWLLGSKELEEKVCCLLC